MYYGGLNVQLFELTKLQYYVNNNETIFETDFVRS